MSSQVILGIDVGTYHVKVVVAEYNKAGGPPRIVGTGFAESRGMRQGYIVSMAETQNAIARAVKSAESEANTHVKSGYLAIGGVGLEDMNARGETIITRADGITTETDIENALAEAERGVARELTNKKIIHAIPLSFTIDGTKVLGRPLGMRGSKLAVQVLFIVAIDQHVADLMQAVENAGIEVIDVIAAPIAASLVSLSKAQKIAGCMLTNIGSETVSTIVFEENTPVSLKVFPIGSSQMTNDLALQLKISIEEAEQLKRGAVIGVDVPKKKIDDTLTLRAKEMLKLIQAHLKKIGRDGLLPAGIILTGGGSGFTNMHDLARTFLKLPASRGTTKFGERGFKDATWAVAYGVCVWGASANDDEVVGVEIARRTGGKVLRWLKQFLP